MYTDNATQYINMWRYRNRDKHIGRVPSLSALFSCIIVGCVNNKKYVKHLTKLCLVLILCYNNILFWLLMQITQQH